MNLPKDPRYDDLWTREPRFGRRAEQPVEIEGTRIAVKIIEGVFPLDSQLGVYPPRGVPDTLHGALFGEPAPSQATISMAEGELAHVPKPQTYAILDGAKVLNLPELLIESGLEHRCLFSGAAYDELSSLAPWLVHLKEHSRFTRNLFTHSSAPWHLWSAEAGIYLRSHEPLNHLWRYMRRFTRVQTDDGKWFYFRFWEPKHLRATSVTLMASTEKRPTPLSSIIGVLPKSNQALIAFMQI